MTPLNYAIALVVTLLIELTIAYVLGFKTKRLLFTIALVNFVTHPVLWYVQWIGSSIFHVDFGYFIITVFEIVVVMIEASLLYYVTRTRYLAMLKLAFIMNVVSYGVGVYLIVYF